MGFAVNMRNSKKIVLSFSPNLGEISGADTDPWGISCGLAAIAGTDGKPLDCAQGDFLSNSEHSFSVQVVKSFVSQNLAAKSGVDAIRTHNIASLRDLCFISLRPLLGGTGTWAGPRSRCSGFVVSSTLALDDRLRATG